VIFFNEVPVSDETFTAYLGMYKYDKEDLNEIVEYKDDSNKDWNKEKIKFDAAYGDEQVIAYLFTPKNILPPYQTVVYFPGSAAIFFKSSDSQLRMRYIDFIIKSGRAVMYPIYKSTYERGDDLKTDTQNETQFWKDHVILWAKDLSRSIDYLETRRELNTDSLVYYGYSWGSVMGGIIPAVEKRLKFCILYVAGLSFHKTLPEVDSFNFLSRINIPVLMLNGEFDPFFPVKTSQEPFYNQLGTPKEHKHRFRDKTGHYVQRVELMRRINDWLNKYLGPVKKQNLSNNK